MNNRALRYNEGKTKWSLVCFRSLVPMVEVLSFGTKKYSPNNWKKGMSYNEICESLLRHIFSFMKGQDRDKESKLLEVGHILCNALFLSYMFLFKKEFDDRFKEDYNININNEKNEITE